MAKVIDFGYKKVEEDLNRYIPVLTIAQAAKEKNTAAVVESTQYFLKNLGVSEEDAKIFMPKDQKGLESLLQILLPGFVPKFEKVMGKAKLKDLRNYYSDSFEKFYTKENLPKVDEAFNSDETYESFKKKYEKAAEIAQSETGNFTDEQKKKAAKDLEKLNKIMLPLEEFRKLKVEESMKPHRTNSLREGMNSLYEEPEQEQAEAA